MEEQTPTSTVRLRLAIRGRVQGVAYRASARDAARRIGVSGWVRNRPDGSVEAAVEGDPETVARFVTWCEQGPPLARVDEVRRVTEPPEGLASFDVRY